LQDSEKKNFVLENLPSAELYEKSYMHRDVVDGIVSALETDFVMTTSLDGNLKFWKKNYAGIEFVKHYKAHKGKITGISISHNGAYMATCSFKDESLKIFDVNNFDMIVYIQLKFVPLYCEFVSKINDPELIIAVTEYTTYLI
jgi:peptidylprolyl isomerase domain and WD repeat-containing protein 1